MNQAEPLWQQGQLVELVITDLSDSGDGVGRLGQRVVFVPDTVTGDRGWCGWCVSNPTMLTENCINCWSLPRIAFVHAAWWQISVADVSGNMWRMPTSRKPSKTLLIKLWSELAASKILPSTLFWQLLIHWVIETRQPTPCPISNRTGTGRLFPKGEPSHCQPEPVSNSGPAIEPAVGRS